MRDYSGGGDHSEQGTIYADNQDTFVWNGRMIKLGGISPLPTAYVVN